MEKLFGSLDGFFFKIMMMKLLASLLPSFESSPNFKPGLKFGVTVLYVLGSINEAVGLQFVYI